MTRNEVERILKQDEGFSSKVYLDSKGVPTVGWGHALFGAEAPKVGTEFTMEQCELLFRQDLDSAYAGYARLDLPNISPAVRGVIVQMIFNLGLNGVCKFRRFLAAVRDKDYKLAAFEMLDSKWHREDVKKRAVRLARIVFNAKLISLAGMINEKR